MQGIILRKQLKKKIKIICKLTAIKKNCPVSHQNRTFRVGKPSLLVKDWKKT